MFRGRCIALLSLYTLQVLASNDVISLYGKFEMCLHLDGDYKNPFNYSEVLICVIHLQMYKTCSEIL